MRIASQEVSFLEQLRTEFDRDFAKPAHAESANLEEYLGFSTADGKYAVLLQQVGAVQEIRTVTRVPGGRAGFEGLATVQDQLVAVYDLAALIAAPGRAGARRWLLVCQADRQVGFAIDAVDGYLRVPLGHIVQAQSEHRVDSIRQAIDQQDVPRLVVDLVALIAAIRRNFDLGGQAAQ